MIKLLINLICLLDWCHEAGHSCCSFLFLSYVLKPLRAVALLLLLNHEIFRTLRVTSTKMVIFRLYSYCLLHAYYECILRSRLYDKLYILYSIGLFVCSSYFWEVPIVSISFFISPGSPFPYPNALTLRNRQDISLPLVLVSFPRFGSSISTTWFCSYVKYCYLAADDSLSALYFFSLE